MYFWNFKNVDGNEWENENGMNVEFSLEFVVDVYLVIFLGKLYK